MSISSTRPAQPIFARPVFIALATYLFTLGATFNGIFLPAVAAMTLPLLGVLIALWWVWRWRGRWRWHRTPLDAALMLWGGAIALSLIANSGDWRRIAIGIWYVGIYLLVWYVLSDMLANGGLRPAVIVDGLLVAGGVVLAFGYWQLALIVANGYRYPGFFGLPRPGSIIGNPNSLAALLIVMIGFAWGRLLSASTRAWRRILIAYLVLTGVMLFLTYSRGGWLGAAAAAATAAGLWAFGRGLISPERLRDAWGSASRARRIAALTALVVVTLMLAVFGLIFLDSFNESGRSADLRTYIWESALTLFGEKPLTGHGLFTFGKGLQRLNSMPPISPHSHAHNLPLNVLAELGLVGFAALALSIALALWAIRRNWQQAAGERERAILIAGIAASVGFGVHHLFDAPLLMPAIALAGLLATVVAVAPIKPVPMVWRWRALGHGLALAGSGVLLIVSGGWSSRVYTHYTEIVAYGLSSRDYVGAAQQLESILDADPAMPMYHWQQGIFYGVDAYVNASAESANASAAAFERYLMLEPQNAVAWANLGALRRQLGSTTAAQDAFARATALAPESWQLAVIEARAGQGENAAAAYRRALAIEPALILLPEVAALGLDITTPLDGLAAVVERSLDGDVAGAAALWDSAPIQTVPGYAVRAVLALETGEREAGLAYLAEGDARLYSDDTPNLAWVRWAQARFDGDNPDAARRLITPDLFDPDYVNGINLAWAQFLRDVTPRLFLPQVDYAISDVLLIALLQPG